MKEIDTNCKVVNSYAIEESIPFTRILEEKHALDEKIVKLNAFLKDEERAERIAGFWQLGQMREQLDVMLRYSGILNTRILTWRHNK